jgi:hypothetical protein
MIQKPQGTQPKEEKRMPLRELSKPKGPISERTTADGRRRLKLNQDERKAFLTSTQIDRIVHMVLNI